MSDFNSVPAGAELSAYAIFSALVAQLRNSPQWEFAYARRFGAVAALLLTYLILRRGPRLVSFGFRWVYGTFSGLIWSNCVFSPPVLAPEVVPFTRRVPTSSGFVGELVVDGVTLHVPLIDWETPHLSLDNTSSRQEMAQPHSVTHVAPMPKCQVTLQNDTHRFGSGFRHGDWLVTALHVGDLCSEESIIVNSTGVRAVKFQGFLETLTFADSDVVGYRFPPGLWSNLGVSDSQAGSAKTGAVARIYSTSLARKSVVSSGPLVGKAPEVFLGIKHNISTRAGDSGSPIFVGNNVVGVHLGNDARANYGTVLAPLSFLIKGGKESEGENREAIWGVTRSELPRNYQDDSKGRYRKGQNGSDGDDDDSTYTINYGIVLRERKSLNLLFKTLDSKLRVNQHGNSVFVGQSWADMEEEDERATRLAKEGTDFGERESNLPVLAPQTSAAQAAPAHSGTEIAQLFARLHALEQAAASPVGSKPATPAETSATQESSKPVAAKATTLAEAKKLIQAAAQPTTKTAGKPGPQPRDLAATTAKSSASTATSPAPSSGGAKKASLTSPAPKPSETTSVSSTGSTGPSPSASSALPEPAPLSAAASKRQRKEANALKKAFEAGRNSVSTASLPGAGSKSE